MGTNNQQQMSIKIDLDSLPNYVCPKCQGLQWAPVYIIKAVSSLTSPNGRAGSMNHQIGFMCTGCGYGEEVKEIATKCKEMVEKEPQSNIVVPITGGKIE